MTKLRIRKAGKVMVTVPCNSRNDAEFELDFYKAPGHRFQWIENRCYFIGFNGEVSDIRGEVF